MIFIRKNNFVGFLFCVFISFSFFGCDPEPNTYSLDINFKHFVDNDEIVFANDSIIYQNNSGVSYSVRRILYVLSDVTLYLSDGSIFPIDDFIFVNTDDPSTLFQSIDNLPSLCVGINFRLGFSFENNTDNNYINASNNFHLSMLWPNLNGTNLAFQGGYHYMKLEGKYIDNLLEEAFYNTHTGPTNLQDFSILYPEFYFSETSSINITMNVNNWYNNPVYDLNIFGSAIMANLDAQNLLYQNASDVFSIDVN